MSFTHLLAVGRSVMGIKKDPGPYRMNQQNLLPKFSSAGKGSVSAAVPIVRDAAPVAEGQTPDLPAIARSAEAAADVPAAQTTSTTRQERATAVMSGLRRLWARLGQERSGASSRRQSRPAVQGELSLDQVKVVRNDLSDSDRVVGTVSRKSGWRLRGRDNGNGGAEPVGIVWNRLTARLLREAAQEFTVVQKERGKLLSQAGNGGGGARGA